MDRPVHITIRKVDELTTGYGAALAYAPDGEHWGSASYGVVQLWHRTEPELMLEPPTAESGRMRFDRDGTRLLLAPYVFDVATGTWTVAGPVFGRLDPPLSEPGMFEVADAVWDRDGQGLVVAARFRGAGGVIGERERVVLLRGADRTPVATLYEGADEVRGLAIDDRFVAVAIKDITIWSREERRDVATLSGHAITVTDLAFSPDGHWLASIDGRGVVLVWDTERWGEPVARIQTSSERGLAVAWHPSRPVLATGGYDGAVQLWAVPDPGGPIYATPPLGGWVEGLAFAPNGRQLIAAVRSEPVGLVLFAVE